MGKLHQFSLALLLGVVCYTSTAWADISQNKDVQVFIDQMVTKYQFNKDQLTEIFTQADFQDEIVHRTSNPAEALPWNKYEKIFMTPKRINEGVAFWKQHEKTLDEAEKQYGVPASVIVSILGVETLYGEHQGKFKVIDALSTLSFKYPPRSKFFKKELEQYFLMTRENNINPLKFKGSYAGAIGAPQFMPSSYRAYAIDYNNDGHSDLQNNMDDAIFSTANYLNKNGWQKNGEIAVKALVKGNKFKQLPQKQKRYNPQISLKEMRSYGIQPLRGKYRGDTKALFMKLKDEPHSQYWLGFENFYVITRYNPSLNYAMTVYQLSDALKKAKKKAA